MKKYVIATFSVFGISNVAFAYGINWCPDLTASVSFSCNDSGRLTIKTVERVSNSDDSAVRKSYEINFSSLADCRKSAVPLQKKFPIVTAPIQAQFAICDKQSYMHTLMINEGAKIRLIDHEKKSNCAQAAQDFNDSYPASFPK